MADARFEQLKAKYQSVMNFMQAQNVRIENLNMADNKLYIRAEAPSQDVKNKVWDQIKLVDPSFSDLTADLTHRQQQLLQRARLRPGPVPVREPTLCSPVIVSRRSADSFTATPTST
jgi:hypothetical protein